MLSLCLYVYLPFPSLCQGFRSLVSILFLPVHWGSFSFCLKRGFHEAFFHEALLVIYPLFFSQNIFILHSGFKGLSKWLSGKESACQCRRCRRLGFNPCVRKISWSSKWQPTPVFLPGTFQGQRSLVGYSPYGRRESDMTEQLHTHTHTHTEDCRTLLLDTEFWAGGICAPHADDADPIHSLRPASPHLLRSRLPVSQLLQQR